MVLGVPPPPPVPYATATHPVPPSWAWEGSGGLATRLSLAQAAARNPLEIYPHAQCPPFPSLQSSSGAWWDGWLHTCSEHRGYRKFRVLGSLRL